MAQPMTLYGSSSNSMDLPFFVFFVHFVVQCSYQEGHEGHEVWLIGHLDQTEPEVVVPRWGGVAAHKYRE